MTGPILVDISYLDLLHLNFSCYLNMFVDVLLYTQFCSTHANAFQSQILEAVGATVERVRPVSITHRDHYVNIARRRASEANELASKHLESEQMNGKDLDQIHGDRSGGEKESSFFLRNYKCGFFADQFENLANFRAHYQGTGPEIWEQTEGKLDAFVAAAGTGGTVAGVSKFLQVHCFSLLFKVL